MIKSILNSHTLVFGCGNPLFGDDGFGPAVIQFIETYYARPEGCAFIDVGTSIRDILFDVILSEQRPERIIIIDAVDMPNRAPGELFDIDIEQMNPEKISDFSLHQFPTTNMLQELRDNTPIRIEMMVVQIKHIPDVVTPGLSETVEKAVPVLADRIIREVGGDPASRQACSPGEELRVKIEF